VTRGRLASLTALAAVSMTVAGCHRESTRAYQPPPPPSVNASSNRSRGAASTRRDDATAAPIPFPAPVPGNLGHPVSSEVGLASWYGPPYAGRKGADGTVYDQNAMTAAHLTLPMGTMVRVTNLTNNQSVVVKITDRGPFVKGRIIDLSLAAAKATGVYRAGVAKVRVEAFAPPVRTNANPDGRWCVQVGAFARESDAVKLKEDLLRRYTTAKVIEFPGPTGYWVRVNPKFPSRSTATEVADGIHPKDPAAQPYLIRTD
jgi:rare lipoprotein A